MGYRQIITGLLCAAMAWACAKPELFERELGLQSRFVEVGSGTGTTPVMVFSNTSWTAKFVSGVDWASLDRLSGSCSSQVKFSWGGNYGRARKVKIAFAAGSARDTLVIVQASGIAEPYLSLTPSTLNIGADVTQGKVLLTTNIQENLEEVQMSVIYPDGGEAWISDIALTQESLLFNMSPNTGTSSRRATITMSHTDAYDKEISAQLYVTQNPA